LAEVEPRTIQHLETGTANPTIGVVATVAAALGVTASTLLRPAKMRPRRVGRPRRRKKPR
jgi:transcriptional regulator with XRE-family HTH domain